ncbi:desulfoferrodoxin family protein [Olsenella intestinalis]|uniref:desulfoferrodoxin family protein n=1 Tax=Olsenella intestinalis TaxID=2930083 RepID=UPI00200D85FF|nr:desulfoferrodoxin family protein [Olsenella intestinalis]
MSDVIFYRCNKCGNLVYVVNRGTCTPQCCGEPMERLEAGSVDAAAEKHVPAVTREGDKLVVRVGEVAHPMLEEHHIEWLAVCAEGKTLIRRLDPTGAPEATFCGGFAEHGEVYAYCNLHGLWKAEF